MLWRRGKADFLRHPDNERPGHAGVLGLFTVGVAEHRQHGRTALLEASSAGVVLANRVKLVVIKRVTCCPPARPWLRCSQFLDRLLRRSAHVTPAGFRAGVYRERCPGGKGVVMWGYQKGSRWRGLSNRSAS